MLDMLILSRKTNIWPERGVIKYIRSSIAIDGLITRFAPGFDLGQHLASVCQRFMKWQTRRELFSYNNLVEWTFSNAHLAGDGALRAASVLRQMAGGVMPARAELEGRRDERDEALRARAMHLATVAFAGALLVVAARERVQLGVNLFTAEVSLVLAATALLLRTVVKLKAT
nr:hypothetical protein [Acidobacteriota bacterium]